MGYTYSILIDLAGELVVIVGGGVVAARKAQGAIAAGGRVRVVATRFSPNLSGEVQRICEPYVPAHLAGARLVFAATDDRAVNDAVVRDAKSTGIWVNRVDGEEAGEGDREGAGNFVVPAQFNNEGVIVSVSAGSPAVSVAIRGRLAKRFDPAWARMAAIAKKLRPMVRTSGLAPSRRKKILQEIAEFLEKDAKEEEVREWLRRRLAEESR